MSITPQHVTSSWHDSTEAFFSAKKWRLVTDHVMGGISEGELGQVSQQGYDFNHLSGDVNTANNGGFIKMAHDLNQEERFIASDASGIRFSARGNNEDYGVILRTSDLSMPWQSYKHRFTVTEDWQTFELPFAHFEPYQVNIEFNPRKLIRVSVMASGRDFHADLYVADVGFY